MIVFGPVTSRRLGKSLGINHIPPKYCTYSCVYCQVGKTNHLIHERKNFYEAEEVYEIVKNKLEQLSQIHEVVDFITLVPDGEPTLDNNLNEIIEKLKNLGPPIAVITNGSLLGDMHVRDSLKSADWVCIKVDTVEENSWKKINRPHESLDLKDILAGIELFTESFKGNFVTESMLIKNLNDSPETVRETAKFIKKLQPRHSYLLIPTRPPAELWVQPPEEQIVTEAYHIFKEYCPKVTLLIDFPADKIPVTSHLEDEILALTSVHPLRQIEVNQMIKDAKSEDTIIERLIKENKLIKTDYNGYTFYLRKFSS